MNFRSEIHSEDVNKHSGRPEKFILFSPESIFTSPRNPYSHPSGNVIHMPRNTHREIRHCWQVGYAWNTQYRAGQGNDAEAARRPLWTSAPSRTEGITCLRNHRRKRKTQDHPK